MIRPLAGIAHVAVARWTRGPLLPVALLLLGLALMALPPSLASDSAANAWRDDASFALGVIGWITLALGAVLPIAGGAVAGRRAESRVVGGRTATLGHLGALWLLCAVVACAGAAETSAWLRWRHGNVESTETTLLSAPVWRNSERLSCTTRDPLRVAVQVPEAATNSGSLRIATTFRIASPDQGPAGPPSLTLRTRTNDSAWHERSVRPNGVGGLVATVACSSKTKELLIEFSAPVTNAVLTIVPHGLVVSGAPVPSFGALMRGALIVAAMGIAVSAFVVLLSRHVHVALAVTLGFLLAILSATLASHRAEVLPWIELVGRWLPGASTVDPGLTLRAGLAPTWDAVLGSFWNALLWTILATLVPQRRGLEERRG